MTKIFRKLGLLFGLLSIAVVGFSQEKITVSGYLSDKASGEALLFASIYIKNSTIGINTNEYGFYSLDIPFNQSTTIVYSYLGYTDKEVTILADKDQAVNVKLTNENSVLTEVEVKAKRVSSEKEAIRSTQTSSINIPIERIKTLPSLGGEVDIIKVAQLLPGVAKGGEGGSGMFVRGGDADQNLVLLDEATVYNIGHLFGFFSVFNPDAIKDMTIIKGGFPAHYGGRLSSVLDIRMKDGNNQKIHAEGGIGLLSSRLTIEAPIKKDRASFLLSGRRTYIDKVFKLANQSLPYYFYDFNAKFNYRFSDRDRLFLSGYFGSDVLSLAENGDNTEPSDSTNSEGFGLNFGFKLGNFTQTARWNHIYHPKLFSNLSLIHTKFNYNISGDIGNSNVLIKSDVEDIGLKFDFTNYRTAKSKLRFGTQVIWHQFRPNITSAKGDISQYLKNKKGKLLHNIETAIYGNIELDINEQLKINGGLRLTGAIVKNKAYIALEPRLSMSYALNDFNSFKLSYSRMYQYMHRVSSSSVALPTDLWYPISKNVKPQSSHQVAAAYTYFQEGTGLEFTLEGYFKTMKNLIEYKEGSSLILNDNFEDLLLQGKGKSYGAEFLIRRQKGKLSGWIGYTLAWSTRKFDDLNEGKRFWAKYDRRHNLSIVGNWDISKRFTFSAIWVYASGSRFTPVRAQYLYPNASLTKVEFIPIYSERNEYSMSASHRLDLNFVIRNNPRKRFRSEWHIGGYNVYNRATPYRINVKYNDTTGALQYEQPGLFGFIPSIAYNFKF